MVIAFRHGVMPPEAVEAVLGDSGQHQRRSSYPGRQRRPVPLSGQVSVIGIGRVGDALLTLRARWVGKDYRHCN